VRCAQYSLPAAASRVRRLRVQRVAHAALFAHAKRIVTTAAANGACLSALALPERTPVVRAADAHH
jgi:hypothetical protein